MQEDFHYYATYCASWLAGYTHDECMEICYSAQFVDWCTRTLLKKIRAPLAAATTQMQLELMDARTDPAGLQDITRIWSSFHFLPRDLYAPTGRKHCSKSYRNKYRLICGPNGDLVVDTVNLARGAGLQAAGVAMHVLADTWAHQHFAGTPSLVINDTGYYFYEILKKPEGICQRHISFRHNPSAPDDPEEGKYTSSLRQSNENNIMNLGHGRAGHLPDYSFIRYRYLPAWGQYEEVIKDNPSDYLHAFCQMVYALRYLRGDAPAFAKDTYEAKAVWPWRQEIRDIILRRQIDACKDWKELGERMSGRTIEDFDIEKYQEEYTAAAEEEKKNTFLGKFILAAMAQKSMVTNKIFSSGNMLAGISVDFDKNGFKGIGDFAGLVEKAAQSSVSDELDNVIYDTEQYHPEYEKRGEK